MKKKYLEIKVDSSVLFEERFNSESYPDSGIFEVSEGSSSELIFVDKAARAAYCVGVLSSPLNEAIIERETVEQKPLPVQQQELRECTTVASGVNENTLLKAIAIAQNPELAMQLIKED